MNVKYKPLLFDGVKLCHHPKDVQLNKMHLIVFETLKNRKKYIYYLKINSCP